MTTIRPEIKTFYNSNYVIFFFVFCAIRAKVKVISILITRQRGQAKSIKNKYL